MSKATLERPATTRPARTHNDRNDDTSIVRTNNSIDDGNSASVQSTDLRDSPMMAHLLDALDRGEDIGHFGRLTFIMVARHFMDEDELVSRLTSQPEQDDASVRAMLTQVKARNYCPPKRQRILDWQAQQDFPICPDPQNPGACNVYRELKFPEDIYEEVQEFWEEQATKG